MHRAQLTAAVSWVVFGALFLAENVWETITSDFALSVAYYAVSWGFFSACILAGVLAALGKAVGRWLVATTALIAVLHQLWLVLGYAGSSNRLWVVSCLLFIAYALVVAAFMFRKQPNSTPHSDARDVPAPAEAPAARAGYWER